MKRYSLVAVLLVSTLANIKALAPEDIGEHHTLIFNLLGEKYATEKPQNKLGIMSDVRNLFETHYNEDFLDGQAIYNHNVEMKEFQSILGKDVEYPEDFDLELKEHLHKMRSTLTLLGDENLDDILNRLTEIHEDIVDATNVNELYKTIAIGGSSIAVESLKLWYETFTNIDHPLHSLIVSPEDSANHERGLQGTITIDIPYGSFVEAVADIVVADVDGAMGGTLELLNDNPGLIFAVPLLPFVLIFYAIFGSANAAFG